MDVKTAIRNLFSFDLDNMTDEDKQSLVDSFSEIISSGEDTVKEFLNAWKESSIELAKEYDLVDELEPEDVEGDEEETTEDETMEEPSEEVEEAMEVAEENSEETVEEVQESTEEEKEPVEECKDKPTVTTESLLISRANRWLL